MSNTFEEQCGALCGWNRARKRGVGGGEGREVMGQGEEGKEITQGLLGDNEDFFGHTVQLAGSQFPDQGLNPGHSSESPES